MVVVVVVAAVKWADDSSTSPYICTFPYFRYQSPRTPGELPKVKSDFHLVNNFKRDLSCLRWKIHLRSTDSLPTTQPFSSPNYKTQHQQVSKPLRGGQEYTFLTWTHLNSQQKLGKETSINSSWVLSTQRPKEEADNNSGGHATFAPRHSVSPDFCHIQFKAFELILYRRQFNTRTRSDTPLLTAN